jgi:beta-lactamase regulating signal transducer with metallopeptidase domain
MNDYSNALLWSALQVTLLALAALASSAFVTRRAPATAARLTALAFVVSGVLTTLAFCPLPDWWNWHASQTVAAVKTPQPEIRNPKSEIRNPRIESATARDTASGWDIKKMVADHWWPRLRVTMEPALQADERRPSWLVLGFLGGAAVALLRLLFGLAAVARCHRRSALIVDHEWQQLLKQLCGEIGIAFPVELREASDLTTPAMVGWLRPAVLLPSDWRSWSIEDRRAVLAHELAHVRRRDYFTWLLTRLVLALHFYHPLLYWLAARLRLQQELAADALGAQHAGGSGNYLRALARLALRQDDRCGAVPTLAFLSSPGTLLRRIAMLRATDGRPYRLPPRGVRVAGFVLLIAVALGASALRAPAEKPVAPDAPQAPASETPSVEPFDLSYLATDANVAMAFRPSAIFSKTSMKQDLEKANQALTEVQHEFNADAKMLLRIEDIEQIVCSGVMRTDKKAKQEQTSLMCHMFVFRTVKDFDWKSLLVSLIGGVKAIQIEGKTCYQPLKDDFWTKVLADHVGGEDVCFYIVDRRTLVMGTKDGIGAMLRARVRKTPMPEWQADWKHVEHGLFAVAIADTSVLNERSEPDVEMSKGMRTLLSNTTSFVGGLDWIDGLTCQAILRSPNEKAAAMNGVIVKELITRDRTAVGQLDASKETTKERKAVHESLLKNCEVRREGVTVILRGSAKASFGDMVNALLSGNLGL